MVGVWLSGLLGALKVNGGWVLSAIHKWWDFINSPPESLRLPVSIPSERRTECVRQSLWKVVSPFGSGATSQWGRR